MPTSALIKLGAFIALGLALVWFARDWRVTHEQLATEKAAKAQIVQAYTDSVRSKDEALRRLDDEVRHTQVALAQANKAEARARERAQVLGADVARLARAHPDVSTYLATPIPAALLERLRNGTSPDSDDEDRGPGGAPRSEPSDAGARAPVDGK